MKPPIVLCACAGIFLLSAISLAVSPGTHNPALEGLLPVLGVLGLELSGLVGAATVVVVAVRLLRHRTS